MSHAEKVNILLVDDQPGKLMSYEAILAPLDENLIKASSGKEALEHLLRTDIAVVLIDVCMPDIDGFELAAMIREHPRHQRVAIIFVSAVHLTDIDRLRGYESGGVDYVSVPVEPEILRARVTVFADLHRKTRQLEQLNRELEERVAARTSELTDAATRLRESEAILRETGRRKDEFLAMLSHELRNPLAPIRNTIEVLRRRADAAEEVRWSYDLIERQLSHLTRLVEDLLDVSRITYGRLEIRREPADLAAIVRDAAVAVQPELGAKGLQLQVELPATPIPVVADVVRLTQVVRNLLDNAFKFTPAGGSVWLTGERGPDGARITVRDSGAGIAAEELPHVFRMFYQPSRHPAPSQGGLGIGLALVRRIVEMHEGTVEVTSAGPGQGSEFTIRLPLGEALPEPRTEPRLRDDALARAPRRRVLVVDDNVDSAESLALLLRRGGSEVRTAYDGLAAVITAESFRPDVVLLDIGLPVLDGYHAARRIRQQPWGGAMTLAALTGWGQPTDLARSREAGFDAHLVKPVDYAAVVHLLDTPRSRQRAAVANLAPNGGH
jgi:signal transduction histidine kinase